MEAMRSDNPPQPTSEGSSGWAACRAGPAATRATSGPRMKPRPSEAGHGTGSTARAAINRAPPSATRGITSTPLTQPAVAVELAMAYVSRKTIRADQSTPPPTDDRARPHSSSRASARRSLGDANCIPGPHEAREIVAPAHDIEVDVLAEIEARVLVRTAEASDVQVKDDQRRTPSADRLKQAHPRGVGAGGDHGDGAAGQPADLVPRERLGQRRAAVGLGDGEVVEDQAVLPDRAVRLQDRPLRIVRDEPDLPASAVDLRRLRRGEAHRVLDRRFLAFARMHVAVEVEEDPEVGRQRLLEGLRHEPAVAGGKRPVDAAEAVAGRVIADASGLRRVVGPGAE